MRGANAPKTRVIRPKWSFVAAVSGIPTKVVAFAPQVRLRIGGWGDRSKAMATVAPPAPDTPTNARTVMAHTAWLEGPGELVWRKEALTAPGPNEVLCETLVSAISPGTELAAWRGAPPLRPGNPYPRVQGYCNVARVLEAGEEVDGLARGDRVLTLQSHRSHFVCAPSEIYLTLEPDMDTQETATSYLFHLGYNAVLRGGVRAGSRVVVIGLGVLGLTSVAMGAHAGAMVYAISEHRSARKIAIENYSAHTAHSRDDVAALEERLGGGADVVILTTNSWRDYELSLRIAGRNAAIACLGFPGREQPPGDYNPLAAEPFYTKQLRIEAVGLSPLENDPRGFTRFNLRDNLGFLARTIAPRSGSLISGVYPADQLERAYTDLAARKDNAVTYLLDWAA